MRNTFLEFEQPLAELENKIEQLRYVQADSAVDISDEIGRLQQKSQSLAKEIYAKLTPWQTALVARHPQRPYSWTTCAKSSPTSTNCTATACTPTTSPSWAAWRASTARPAW